MYEYDAWVMRVIDGDTVELEVELGFHVKITEKFRLLGIDTPESRTKDLAEKKHGLEATKFVEDAILDRPITIRTHKDKRGKYGRYLAEIEFQAIGADGTLEKLDLAAALRRGGFEKRESYANS